MLMTTSTVNANMKAAEKDKLPDDEVLAQIGYVSVQHLLPAY